MRKTALIAARSSSNTVLEQVNANVILTSSRSDEKFIDTLHDFGTHIATCSHPFPVTKLPLAETASSTFQIRPHKEFTPTRGKERLLSLRVLSELSHQAPSGHHRSSSATMSSSSGHEIDVLGRRHVTGLSHGSGDPTLKTRNAAIRLGNYAGMDAAPLAVRRYSLWFFTIRTSDCLRREALCYRRVD